MLEAYCAREAQGLIEARPRSGFYVRTDIPGRLREPEISAPQPDPARVSVRELVTRLVLTDTHNPELV